MGLVYGGQPLDQASTYAAMQSRGVNVVRVPLNEDCWLAINGVNASAAGAAYQQAIQTEVSLIHQAGMYVILDLHWTAPGTQLALSQNPAQLGSGTNRAGRAGNLGDFVVRVGGGPRPGGPRRTAPRVVWPSGKSGSQCRGGASRRGRPLELGLEAAQPEGPQPGDEPRHGP